MITVTTLKHPNTVANIRKACYNVLRKGYSVEHVRNGKGQAYIAVRYRDGLLEFTDRHGNNITKQVAKSVRRVAK